MRVRGPEGEEPLPAGGWRMPLGMISALTSFTCFRDFLIMGCGLSSSSENARVRGSKSRPDDAIENAGNYIMETINTLTKQMFDFLLSKFSIVIYFQSDTINCFYSETGLFVTQSKLFEQIYPFEKPHVCVFTINNFGSLLPLSCCIANPGVNLCESP